MNQQIRSIRVEIDIKRVLGSHTPQQALERVLQIAQREILQEVPIGATSIQLAWRWIPSNYPIEQMPIDSVLGSGVPTVSDLERTDWEGARIINVQLDIGIDVR